MERDPKAAGVIFCQFAHCGPAGEGKTILKEIAPKLGYPVFADYPFGHVPRSYCIDFCRPATVKNGKVTFPAMKKCD